MRQTIKLLGCCLLLLSFSCVPNKKLIYLQNLEGETPIPESELIEYEIPDYRLQFNDIIDVQLKTIEDLLRDGLDFQTQMQQNMQMGQMAGQGGGDIYYMTGYTVNKEGKVRLPVIGEVLVADLTIEEARAVIEDAIKEMVTSEIFVKVKLGGIRYSAIGEFRRPGKFVVLQDRMTILEAVAHAGDLNVVAKRDEILLIRQYPDGTKLHRVNLNDRNLIRSPFYFIQPNDQLYAEPMRVREIGAGENAVQTLSLLVSTISAIALVLNLITR
ncbi:polysaccharide biosynthesis/export family protein [Cecembia lonarensis]|uniref:Polysaccharide biosynthesis/export protein n=1 Tax=Cecembia lonarensis (strain CCUG 58316 / KCTC 22772 / LW9) TaxID=1225176 RepID=K1KXQ6_CECL9|nr:polysaccharide biosynthesis/export family protein [Cecembia lonarensis]EKB48890.1 Polysaccharide biosynthesis/export protein [Cecembia lonarensis LW9]